MPPLVGSRYMFCQGVLDADGRRYLTEREPYGYHDHPDTRVHVVVEGDTLFSLAGQYFAPLPRACGFWWAIADFQPDAGILNPFEPLGIGKRIFVPSTRVLTDIILGEARRREQG